MPIWFAALAGAAKGAVAAGAAKVAAGAAAVGKGAAAAGSAAKGAAVAAAKSPAVKEAAKGAAADAVFSGGGQRFDSARENTMGNRTISPAEEIERRLGMGGGG